MVWQIHFLIQDGWIIMKKSLRRWIPKTDNHIHTWKVLHDTKWLTPNRTGLAVVDRWLTMWIRRLTFTWVQSRNSKCEWLQKYRGFNAFTSSLPPVPSTLFTPDRIYTNYAAHLLYFTILKFSYKKHVWNTLSGQDESPPVPNALFASSRIC